MILLHQGHALLRAIETFRLNKGISNTYLTWLVGFGSIFLPFITYPSEPLLGAIRISVRARVMHFGRTIHSLPVELLSHIFVLGTHYLDASEDDSELQETPPFNSESVKAPLVYSSVCKHWRSVAINTPALWTSICITVGSLETSKAKSSSRGAACQELTLKTSHIESYLFLSRRYPLDILLDVRDIDWDFCEPEYVISRSQGSFLCLTSYPEQIIDFILSRL